MTIWLVLGNELMALLTMVVVFPGMLPGEDVPETFAAIVMLGLISLVWPLYLAVFPFCVLLSAVCGDFDTAFWTSAWPWRYLRRR